MAIPEVPPSPKKSDTPLDPAALSEMQKKIHAEFVSTEVLRRVGRQIKKDGRRD